MSDQTIEAFIENGQVKLPAAVHIPERTKVYVLIPDAPVPITGHRIESPRLADREQAKDFVKTVIREKH